MNAKERRRNEAEQRLLDAAAELIGEIGPAAVTLANIGERAGYSRGLVTHHFGSKGAMMQRLVDNVTDEFNLAIFVERPKGSAADELQALMDTYFQTLRELKPVNRAGVDVLSRSGFRSVAGRGGWQEAGAWLTVRVHRGREWARDRPLW
jgi:AcrR family transcriptional regulator